MHALQLDTFRLTKRFGDFVALNAVSLCVRPGTVHALLGENGAGKSTLVKSVVGYYRGDEGCVLIDNKEHDIHSPAVARALGIGMVYQHFTVVPGMTVAENLLMAKGELPAIIHWDEARQRIEAFMATAPFQLDLDAYPADLSAGEKQKLEILKQMFLSPRLLILDEPTSVLTPQEADEVLGALQAKAHAGDCSILMITHKFREVMAYADDVTVLRKGSMVHTGAVQDSTPDALAAHMVGAAVQRPILHKEPMPSTPQEVLQLHDLVALGDRGELALNGLSLTVHCGEIVGLAGVSGNGQKELMQAITGQRQCLSGRIQVSGQDYQGTRKQNRRLKVRSLPEEPLLNGCVPHMSVAENMALRQFDVPPYSWAGWLRWGTIEHTAKRWIQEYGVRTPGPAVAIKALSGGNVQRAVLARELSADANLILVSNPTFGLDFAAAAEIYRRLIEARNRGAAILLISEDLDEVLQLADTVAVMTEGHIAYQCRSAAADRAVIGAHMAGGSHTTATEKAPA